MDPWKVGPDPSRLATGHTWTEAMSREFRARQLIAMRIVDIYFHARLTRDTRPDPRDGSRYLRSAHGRFELLRAAHCQCDRFDVRSHVTCATTSSACAMDSGLAVGTRMGGRAASASLLNAVSELIPEDERVVVIEDSKELALLRDHVVTLEARPADAKGRGEVTIRQLFRITPRMRPDRIVIGELRGGEALDLVQAMTSGHGGCLTTLHAVYPRDVRTRLETMADIEMPLAGLDVPAAVLEANWRREQKGQES